MMFTLTVTNLHWLGDTEKERCRDLCLHGDVRLAVGDTVLNEDEWTVSAGALRFMRSVRKNHYAGLEQHLLPCCGHFMVAREDGRTVHIHGCCNGFDCDVLHEEGMVRLVTEEAVYSVPFLEYRDAVLFFAEAVETFYKSSPPRECEDDLEREGYQAFCNEWFDLKEAIAAQLAPCSQELPEFSDYRCVSAEEVFAVTATGIGFGSEGAHINFRECAYNYRRIKGGDGHCVGEWDVQEPQEWIFYTAPLTTHIFFTEAPKPTWWQRFRERRCQPPKLRLTPEMLQREITAAGYTVVCEEA